MGLSILVSLFAASGAFAQPLAITDAIVYPTAAGPALRATVLVNGDRIQAVGPNVSVPLFATTVQCRGCTVIAGLWNSHVHFTEPKWEAAESQAATKLNQQLQEMLTRSGFTTVVDTASDLANTVALRTRIERGELAGPRILTSGNPVFPPNGVPYYVKEALSPEMVRAMTPPSNAAEAMALVEKNAGGGANIIKLFTGSWVTAEKVLPMPLDIAKAIVQAAHRQHRLVFSHPSNSAGVKVAIDSGVDVLAHAPDDTRQVDAGLIKLAVNRRMTLIPTLKLFSGTGNIGDIRGVVREFQQFGGRLVFGTDTGYLIDYGVSREFEELFRAGLTWRDVLKMLTESPAALFGEDGQRGSDKRGMIADLTILASDPASDPSAFSKVRYVIRNGRIIWEAR